MKDFISSVVSFSSLSEILRTYLDPKDIEYVREAYRFADKAHLGQFRSSGSPYISHPLAVAEICAGWMLDVHALSAALLHDVMEDQGILKHELIEKFGLEVAELVDGLSKLDRLDFANRTEQQAENFRKMLFAISRDIRVILIKLADRLHNMRTIDAIKPEKRRRISKETLDIYAPIAYRLGLNLLFREMQDLCFSAMYPNRYKTLYKAILSARGNRREIISKIRDSVNTSLPASGIKANISSREKTLFGIYTKMVEQKKTFSEVLDIYGLRIIVKTIPECYLALGTLHQLYRPVPGKFKDYIAIPKTNGYQSLHTTLVGPYGIPIEFQLRTSEMHYIAEEGVASHWLYKGIKNELNGIQKYTHQWLQSLLDIQNQTRDSAEFLEHIKIDLFPDAIYVFTPLGKIISLPKGATPVDFAYSIHTDIGNQAVTTKVNGEYTPLRTELNSGDKVEIITSPASRPNAQWLNYVRTGRARSEIRHYLRTMKYEESVAFGERLLFQALKKQNIPLPNHHHPLWKRFIQGRHSSSREEILADIGLGKRLAAAVARRFASENQIVATTAAAVDESILSSHFTPIFIHGGEGQTVQLSICCSPLPGDLLIGVMRLGHGLVVHTSDCLTGIKQRNRDPESCVEVAWDQETAKHLPTRLEIITQNERGVLGRVASRITAMDSNIIQVSTHDDSESATIVLNLIIQVDNRKHLARVIRAIRQVKEVQKIIRLKNRKDIHKSIYAI
ncbi:MAG: bifunctional (p)ppGpp synthetase/guanosine-3',5'-bis(diphosphate) 3'-pyrophosphohydrolase [Bordetella sp.]|nr:MAG: bifunctional (p)ppGpp synthetase/guanosine-3',5'-bis(diphosphate) 3'-pyrophosphohydrolase [Bordetella sp.]